MVGNCLGTLPSVSILLVYSEAMEGCEAAYSLPHHDYSFQVYPSVSASQCNAGIYSTTGGNDWDALSHAVQIFGQIPSYEPQTQQVPTQQQQHQQPFYLQQQQQQQQQHQYVQAAPTCSTPLSVTSSGSDVDIFSPADGGEPLPYTAAGASYSDAKSPQASSRKLFPHHSGKHRPRLPYGGRRRTPPVFPDNSVPIAQLQEKCGSNVSRTRTVPEKDQRLTDVTMEFIQLRSVLHSAASSAARVPMVVELSRDFSRQLEKIENGLLKLQAEKARLVKQARETLHMVAPSSKSPCALETSKNVSPLAVCRTGRIGIDTPHLDEANNLLSAIGGLHQELESAARGLYSSVCSRGQSHQPTTTLAMIRDSLSCLQEQLLKATNVTLHQCPQNGLYQVDHMISSQNQGSEEDSFSQHLSLLNQVLKYAQFITLSNTIVRERLASLLSIAKQRLSSVELLYTSNELQQREQVKSVLEGNCVVLSIAEEVWQQEHQVASDIIKIITQSLLHS